MTGDEAPIDAGMTAFDALPTIVRRAMSEAVSPPTVASVWDAIRKTRDPHYVAGLIRARDAQAHARQQLEIDESVGGDRS